MRLLYQLSFILICAMSGCTDVRQAALDRWSCAIDSHLKDSASAQELSFNPRSYPDYGKGKSPKGYARDGWPIDEYGCLRFPPAVLGRDRTIELLFGDYPAVRPFVYLVRAEARYLGRIESAGAGNGDLFIVGLTERDQFGALELGPLSTRDVRLAFRKAEGDHFVWQFGESRTPVGEWKDGDKFIDYGVFVVTERSDTIVVKEKNTAMELTMCPH